MQKLLAVLFLLGLTLGVRAQAPPVTEGWQAVFFDAPATALPLLAAAAVRHSAELEAIKTDQAIAREDLQIARKGILGALLISNNVGYGNTANVTVADQSLPSVGTVSSQTRYSTGINLNLSLDRLLSRNNMLARQKLLGQKVEQTRQSHEDALRQHVIDLYQSVLLARKVLALRQQSYHTAQVNYQLAEQQFKSGDMLLAEVSQQNDRFIGAAVEQENAISRYTTAFMVLEDVVGCKISELMAEAAPVAPTAQAPLSHK